MTALARTLCTPSGRGLSLPATRRSAAPRRTSVAVRAHTVELRHPGGTTILEVPEDESILSVAIDSGLEVSSAPPRLGFLYFTLLNSTFSSLSLSLIVRVGTT